MISVAAELADMHPQTLRMYESKGLITPRRSARGTRLYSQADVDQLRRIHEMTVELGLNLAGVQQVLVLEERLRRAKAKVREMEHRAEELQQQVAALEALRRELRAEIVPYRAGGPIARREDVSPQIRH
jgi:MerR family transcriptional regulator/heat shock protein HspR